jgi:hypothetical protein
MEDGQAEYVFDVLRGTNDLYQNCIDNGNDPVEYVLFGSDRRELIKISLLPFQLLVLAQMLREGDMIILVRQEDMTDELSNEDPDYQRDPIKLAKTACMAMRKLGDVHEIIPRDLAQDPITSCGINITADSPVLIRRAIQNPTDPLV